MIYRSTSRELPYCCCTVREEEGSMNRCRCRAPPPQSRTGHMRLKDVMVPVCAAESGGSSAEGLPKKRRAASPVARNALYGKSIQNRVTAGGPALGARGAA